MSQRPTTHGSIEAVTMAVEESLGEDGEREGFAFQLKTIGHRPLLLEPIAPHSKNTLVVYTHSSSRRETIGQVTFIEESAC